MTHRRANSLSSHIQMCQGIPGRCGTARLLHRCFPSKTNTDSQPKAGLHLCPVIRMFTVLLVGFSKRSFKQKENFLVPPMGWVEDCQLVIPTQSLYRFWEALSQQCQVCVQNLLQPRIRCSTNRDCEKTGLCCGSSRLLNNESV